MIPHIKYAWYLARHKYFVYVAGLNVGDIPFWRLLIHDYTKLSRAEWGAYVNRFFRPCTCVSGFVAAEGYKAYTSTKGCPHHSLSAVDPEEFHKAFEHHWQHNPHHWEYWLYSYTDPSGFESDGVDAGEMPETYAREMVADWMGAGRAKTGSWDIQVWYLSNRDRMVLHPETRAFVERLVFPHAAVPA